MPILGIDVGGTGIKAALVDTSTGTLLSEKVRIATPKPATPKAIAQSLKNLTERFAYKGLLGVGFPAAIQHGIARTAANIDKSFIGQPIAAYFAEQTGCPTWVANDADVAGLAEMRFGAGKNQQGVVLTVTIGTGLGTALFIDGHLLPNTELGHIFLDNGVEAELYASEAVRVSKHLKWREWGERFSRYLVTMEKLLWPDLIILGGGVSRQLERFRPSLETRAPVVAAHFLNQAGLIGAALFAEDGDAATRLQEAKPRSPAEA